MRGLTNLPNEPGSTAPESRTLCSRLRRVFQGPPKTSPPQPQYRDEKKYKHTPTHSKSSFIRTTTTKDMVAPIQEQLAERQAAEEQLIDLEPTTEESKPSTH